MIERKESEDYPERSKPTQVPGDKEPSPGGQPATTGGGGGEVPATSDDRGHDEVKTAVKRRFYGTININPLTAKMKFADIADEIVQQFTTKTGVKVSISVEIQAESQDGFDESLQRTVKENSNVLGFGSAEFEE